MNCFCKLILLLTYGSLMYSGLAYSDQLDCDQTVHVNCGSTPSAVMYSDQELWVVFVQDGRVYFSTSEDLGATYSLPVAVNKEPEKIYANGENRPKVAIGRQGEVYVSWTKKTEGMYTGDIRFSRSLDGGKTFQKPYRVNDDGLLTSHRFDALQVTESGKVYITWLDKRDQVAVRKEGGQYTGAALYFAISHDSGATFGSNNKVADNSCECCRIAVAPYKEDGVAVLWRHIFPGSIRDHALAVLEPDGRSSYDRATFDNWKINACPHHGPDMIAAKSFDYPPVQSESSENGAFYHMVWFSNGTKQKGIYYALQNLQTSESSQLYSVDSSASASHPQIAAGPKKLYITWKFFDGESTNIRLISSEYQGASWVDEGALLKTRNGSDHPQLIESETGNVFLAWHTSDEGYRIEPIH